MNSQTGEQQVQAREATAPEPPTRPSSPIDPFKLVGLVIEAVRKDCDCRPCKALKKIGESMADSLLGDDEEAPA